MADVYVEVQASLEAPLSTKLFLRLDYTRTDYDEIAFSTTQENADDLRFETTQHLARIGIGFRF